MTWAAASLVAALAVATPAAARVAGATVGTVRLPVVATPLPAGIIGDGTSRETSSEGRRPHGRDAARRLPARPALLVRVPRQLVVRARPRADASAIGIVPSASKYYHVPVTAWVETVSENGRWGRVEIPYVSPRRDGWIRLNGLARSTTAIAVDVDLSAHRLTVTKADRKLFSFPAATGATWSPTPLGEYFVTDRIAFPGGGPLGSFAFGISGTQPHLPAGWSGGNQLAIHGTNNPGAIGTSASAGCVRVSETALARLRPLLQLGTPVVIHA